MGLRQIALYLLVFGLCIYAWKDWFKSLCGLILLMAIIEHSDMPKSMLGIQGLNMWNILFAVIFLAWVADINRRGLNWDMPRHINILLLMYLMVILAGVLRTALDRGSLSYYPLKSLLSEQLINTIKWVMPGILLFEGCRSRKQVLMVLACLLIMYFLIGVQVARRIPASALLSGETIEIARNKCSDIGFSAVDTSVFLAGAFWSMIATLPLLSKKKYKAILLAAAGLVLFSQALTGGRAGYVAWGATGFILCLLKWRKYLLLAPVIVILLPIVMPGAVERMFSGFGITDVSGQSTANKKLITAGRMTIWPYVIDKIGDSPIIGHGRLAMNRTGLTATIESEHYGIGAAQPHNMYLETLLDNGILGSIPILLFWGILVIYAGRLFTSENRLCSAAGGAALALMLTQLVAGLGSQHFYPEESTLGVWASMFLMIRIYLEQKQSQTNIVTIDNSYNSQLHQTQTLVSAYS